MKGATSTVYDILMRMKSSFQGGAKKYISEEPLLGELFSSDKLEEHGRSLARSHKLVTGKRMPNVLLRRLADNERVLLEIRNLLVDTIKDKHRVTPAGEWLLDNFYLIEEQIRTAKKHLPRDYSEHLPQLENGASAGQARVYDLALQKISHSDGRIDIESLSGFVRAYQSVTPLQLGELWAIPIMLRLAMIENLRRVSVRMAIDRIDRNLANYWAEQMKETAEQDPKSLIMVIADMARSSPPLVSAFVSELTRKLRGKGPGLALPLNWIEQRLSESGLNSNDLINEENQKQAADQVSISNSINSLRLLSSMDWRNFVESHSIVEQILREDIDGVYSKMDFTTRDHYRHVVEHFAKKSKLSEAEIARAVIKAAKENKEKNKTDNRASHVGYYLVGKGRTEIKRTVKFSDSVIDIFRNVLNSYPVFFYLSSILFITVTASSLIFLKAYHDTQSEILLIAVALLLLICISQFALTVVNFVCTLIAIPRLLPRIDYAQGIEPEAKTLVVVPSMLTNINDIEVLVESLEVRFLANRDEHLHFGLLTDFTDAREETIPEDAQLLQLIQQKIIALNKKYGREKNDLFYLFHRPRKWNKQDKIWMGYERKRGKLAELNSLLRGKSQEYFSVIIGELSALLNVRYVITLDSDTQLPRGAAWKMIGTMAHPLNRAFYNEKKQRVTEGYGILQPRVMMSLPESNSSHYARLNGNEPGIDPYTRATSDVYQDLFGEGSFIGKGIYEVDVFEKSIAGNFPENRILSHDLLEGCYARSGLLSDVQLFEKYPTSYSSDVKRRIRWTRGDWQIAAWFTPFVQTETKRWQRNPLSGLSRWKIFDNIRRSLVPIALTILLILGWILLHSSFFWTVAVTAIIILPILISSLWNVFKKPKDVILLQHIATSGRQMGSVFVKTMFMLICLPYEAYFSGGAILKTCWRVMISRRKLLEWNPFAQVESKRKNSLLSSYSSMWFELFLAIGVFKYLTIYSPVTLLIAAPVISLWIVSPFVTWYTSQSLKKQVAKLTIEQYEFLQKLSRKTWSFFERFVGQDDNWLPPDNFQEYPLAVIAHRTSPTNIGLSLLSNLCAYDFGFITTAQFIERTTLSINSIEKLERYRGHFYNWYDTQSLSPLLPKYISTVDNGNLVAHILILRQGLLGIPHEKIFKPQLFGGLRDTLNVLCEKLDEGQIKFLEEFENELELVCKTVTLHQANIFIERLKTKFTSIVHELKTELTSDAFWWKETLVKHIEQIIEEFKIVTPWTLLLSVPEKFAAIADVNRIPTLINFLKFAEESETDINDFRSASNSDTENAWLSAFQNSIIESSRITNERIETIIKLGHQCNSLAEMDWDFLYDKTRHLLTIGYKVEEHHTDPSFYDLLASEARLCTFVLIAQGKLPEESWFSLGRLLTTAGGDPILLSWSGSMFEYLMPLLVMPTYENTLLDQTYKACVDRQIEYGKQRDVPWGISESGYNMVDANSNYQYSAFGAPGLGLKRGLAEDLVIAPYATALALMVSPEKSCQNLQQLSEKGFEGSYGLYEAIDYTPSRLQRKQTNVVIQSYMAHHQGMSLLSFAYLLLDKPMQRRFETEPQFQATLLLLQERIPKTTTYYAHTTDIEDINYSTSGTEVRIVTTPNTVTPDVQLLSNGRYHLMLTNSGAGYSRWKDLAVTRWNEDKTCDNWGTFCYIRDLENNTFWSNAHQPTLKRGKNYEAAFSQGRVDFRNSNNNFDSHTEIVVSPEDDIEMRRLHITNRTGKRKTIDVTSYAEVVLATPIADAMAPAFSKLFVQTEIISNRHSILCTRRPRSSDEHPPWMFHLMMVHGKAVDEISFETDRMKFIGRGNSVVNPDAMNIKGALSGNKGSVLDPIVSVRNKITLEPDETVTVDMLTGIGDTRAICEGLIEKYQDKHHKDRVFELAWTHSQVLLRQINSNEADAQLYARLASSIIFSNPALRAETSIISKNQRGQSGLWGYSVSGDLPIVLLRIENQDNILLAKQLVQAHTYWRLKGLAVDLVIWNEDYGGYRQLLQNQIHALIAAELTDRPGGIFVRAADQISNEDRILFQTVARVIISDTAGTLAEQINQKVPPKVVIPYIIPTQSYVPIPSFVPLNKGLEFYNGLGGFSPEGNEYVITIENNNMTPLPWANVIANKNFGTVISESGQCYTWSENAHEFRLTPWNNDPVTDSCGEAFYLRDEETRHFWSPTPLPKRGISDYTTRHGFGYSVFEHNENGINTEMTVFVDIESTIKFSVIKIKNNSGETRKLSVTGYAEWVLGDLKSKTVTHIITETDAETGAIFAKNPYNTEFARRVAFLDVDEAHRTFTCDRSEFIGRNGTLQNPDGMLRQKLSGRTGSGLDPCAAIQIGFDLADGEEREIIFRIGCGKGVTEANKIVKQFRGKAQAHESLEKVKSYWKKTINALQVETPDKAINILTNGWLTYQTLSCRLWGRSGYYQSGGAFGFRDQLQDVISLLHTEPKIAREQILLCASRQFKEGDVQHWWHPPSGRGVRTRCSDDYLWLPYVATKYVLHTGDTGVLNEMVPFLEGRLLNNGEESYYDLPTVTVDHSASLYTHCVLAIKNGFRYGEYGLPLMGSGDWNDGMDKVGIHGKGESIWLAFFLYDILIRFITIARMHNDEQFAIECEKEAQQLKENINRNGWDGEWYRRAYFDDGIPLGSLNNEECQIDSLSQSWAVISGAGEPKRTVTAMKNADMRLVSNDDKIIRLLDPAFDKTLLDPGYIKGYVPGVRENGGQYTHAAVWLIMAFTKMGNTERAYELLKMINPINHALTAEDVSIYKVEPYVMAADVYGVTPHTGRGGWTWYSGAAGWMYQLITDSILGMRITGEKLTFEPCFPTEWNGFKIRYRYRNTVYNIEVLRQKEAGEMNVTVDGSLQIDKFISLIDDGNDHKVSVTVYAPTVVKQDLI